MTSMYHAYGKTSVVHAGAQFVSNNQTSTSTSTSCWMCWLWPWVQRPAAGHSYDRKSPKILREDSMGHVEPRYPSYQCKYTIEILTCVWEQQNMQFISIFHLMALDVMVSGVLSGKASMQLAFDPYLFLVSRVDMFCPYLLPTL